MKMLMLIVLATVGWLTLSGCAPQISLDTNFQLKPEQTMPLFTEQMAIRFDDVLLDDRCPTQMACDAAGEATIAVTLTKPDGWLRELTLSIEGDHDSFAASQVGGYRVHLVALDPYPIIDLEIPRTDYTATFMVEQVTDLPYEKRPQPPTSTSNMTTNNTSLVASPDCGLYGGYDLSTYFAPTAGNLETHIIAIYETDSAHRAGYHPQGKANVYIQREALPMVLVLSAYEPTLWYIHLSPGAKIKQVILNGYHNQYVEGIDNVPVLDFSGEDIPDLLGVYPHTYQDSEAQTLIRAVEMLIDVPITSFTGCYHASEFILFE